MREVRNIGTGFIWQWMSKVIPFDINVFLNNDFIKHNVLCVKWEGLNVKIGVLLLLALTWGGGGWSLKMEVFLVRTMWSLYRQTGIRDFI